MIVECCMCNAELVVENISLVGNRALVRVWPCETCHEEVVEIAIEEHDDGKIIVEEIM